MFESLDFLYVPAPDIDTSIEYYTKTLEAKLLWKIKAMGTCVACLQLSTAGPLILLAEHLEKGKLIHIYRVNDIEKTKKELKAKGWIEHDSLEIPPGPCSTFSDPENNWLAIYENKRPGVIQNFKGRID